MRLQVHWKKNSAACKLMSSHAVRCPACQSSCIKTWFAEAALRHRWHLPQHAAKAINCRSVGYNLEYEFSSVVCRGGGGRAGGGGCHPGWGSFRQVLIPNPEGDLWSAGRHLMPAIALGGWVMCEPALQLCMLMSSCTGVGCLGMLVTGTQMSANPTPSCTEGLM